MTTTEARDILAKLAPEISLNIHEILWHRGWAEHPHSKLDTEYYIWLGVNPSELISSSNLELLLDQAKQIIQSKQVVIPPLSL